MAKRKTVDGWARIGRQQVPIRKAKYPSIADFHSGEHGRFERGEYCFWTVMFKRPVNKRRRIIGRARVILPAGDRFDRMRHEMRSARHVDARKAYRRMWKAMKGGKNVAYVRPSTVKEIQKWIDGHETDAKHIKTIRVNGKLYSV